MNIWYGAAGICMNAKNELLMIKQGKPEEHKTWAVPAGGKEGNESFEECCIREVFEETGYEVEVIRPLHIKKSESYGITVEVHYYLVNIIGGSATIQDPDELIYEIAWKSANEIEALEMGFPEDREVLLKML